MWDLFKIVKADLSALIKGEPVGLISGEMARDNIINNTSNPITRIK
jgi:hypothetical protein